MEGLANYNMCGDSAHLFNISATCTGLPQVRNIFLLDQHIICFVKYLNIWLICASGYLGPGGLHDGNLVPAKCVGGASGYIDRQILGAKHIFQWPTAKEVYGSEAYDPEGLLGNLTAILTVWLGVQTGLTLQVFPKHKSRVVRWAVWAVVTGAIGVALSGAKQTGGVIPLNKNLWLEQSSIFNIELRTFNVEL